MTLSHSSKYKRRLNIKTHPYSLSIMKTVATKVIKMVTTMTLVELS